MGKPADLIQGTLDVLILKTIALEPMHGWGSRNASVSYPKKSSKWVRARSIPHYIGSSNRVGFRRGGEKSENNRRAKYYSLTSDGAKSLRQQQAQWSRLSGAIDLVLQAT